MKKIIISIMALAVCTFSYAGIPAKAAEIVPLPAQVTENGKTVLLQPAVFVYLDSKAGLKTEYVGGLLREMGFSPAFTDKKGSAKIVLEINSTPQNASAEAYQLNVGNKITATADGGAGLHYALQSLRQIAHFDRKGEAGKGGVLVPVCTVTDAPAFSWRAFMIDDSRHFQGMETVKNMMDGS